ncbi:MAG: ATP synthase F1 subunit delta [Anaerovoracaceae bacterium]
MEGTFVAKTYGEALFEAAGERGKQTEILEEVLCLAQLLETSPELQAFLRNPTIPAEEKKQFVESALHEVFSEEMILFLFVLIHKDRIWHLGRIARYYKMLYERQRAESTGKIYSAVPLSIAQVSAFEEAVSALLRKKVRLERCMDPALVGGVIIQVDGKCIDRSVKGELEQLAGELKQPVVPRC